MSRNERINKDRRDSWLPMYVKIKYTHLSFSCSDTIEKSTSCGSLASSGSEASNESLVTHCDDKFPKKDWVKKLENSRVSKLGTINEGLSYV